MLPFMTPEAPVSIRYIVNRSDSMKKEEKLLATKSKLLEAAAALMRKAQDPAEVTSRAIAEKAGVQLAMINYCFGSREALLFEVFRSGQETYQNDPRVIAVLSSDLSPKEKLRQFYYLAVEYLVNEYKFTKAITGHLLLHRDLSEGLGSYPLVAAHYQGRKEEWEIKLISYQLSSMTQLLIFRLEDMSAFLQKELKQEEELRALVDHEIDLLLVD